MRVRAYCNLETGGCVVPTFVRSCPLATKLLQCRDWSLCAIRGHSCPAVRSGSRDTSERIRDKIAASKRKGLWVFLPFLCVMC